MGAMEERIASLEANQRTLFHQLDAQREMLETLRDMNQSLAIQGEAIKRMSADVANMDERLSALEGVPAARWNVVVVGVISGIVGLLVGLAGKLF